MVDPRTLASVDSLTVLSEGERRQLAQHLDAVRFMPGDVLIHEGRRSPGAFLLVEGQVMVRKHVPGSSERVLTRPIPMGEWFGLVSLLDGLPATATVVAQEESLVVAMGRADFWKVIGAGSPFGAHFLRAMLRCTALQLARIDQNVVALRNQMAQEAGGGPADPSVGEGSLGTLPEPSSSPGLHPTSIDLSETVPDPGVDSVGTDS